MGRVPLGSLLPVALAVACTEPKTTSASGGAAPPVQFRASELRSGDIVFQTSRSSQSEAVRAATHSEYSHMGIVYVGEAGPEVFEAAGTVTLTPVDAWARRGEGARVVVKRLAEGSPSPEALDRMKKVGRGLAGKRYDLAFAWDDERMYCSELVYKIYARGAGITLGELQTFGDFDLQPPVVARTLRQRFGDRVPLDETVISPQSIYDDPALATVFDGAWPED